MYVCTHILSAFTLPVASDSAAPHERALSVRPGSIHNGTSVRVNVRLRDSVMKVCSVEGVTAEAAYPSRFQLICLSVCRAPQ